MVSKDMRASSSAVDYQFYMAMLCSDAANRLVMGKVSNGVVTFANPADAKSNLFVQRKNG